MQANQAQSGAQPRSSSGSMQHVAMDKEPELPEVAPDDKMLIRNIIYTAMALNKTERFCKGWQVQCVPRGYNVVFFLNTSYAVSVHDMNIIRELNTSRISNMVIISPEAAPPDQGVGIQQPPVQSKPGVLRVHVLDANQPVMHFDADIVRVRKRARSWR